MVVIKETASNLTDTYGDNFIPRVQKFSTVIGYSVELEDGELKVEFNPDRPDLFSFVSLKAAIETYDGRKSWTPLKFSDKEIGFKIEPAVRDLRPFALAFHCQGPVIGRNFRDLIDFQERIHQSIGKNRSKVSIGIHDLKNVKVPIIYKAVNVEDVKFTTYDNLVSGTALDILNKHPKGIEYRDLIRAKTRVPIIEDANHSVLSMPPVVNGNISTVSENTSDFFIDITGTDPKTLRDAFYLLAYFFLPKPFTLSKRPIVITVQIGEGIQLTEAVLPSA